MVKHFFFENNGNGQTSCRGGVISPLKPFRKALQHLAQTRPSSGPCQVAKVVEFFFDPEGTRKFTNVRRAVKKIGIAPAEWFPDFAPKLRSPRLFLRSSEVPKLRSQTFWSKLRSPEVPKSQTFSPKLRSPEVPSFKTSRLQAQIRASRLQDFKASRHRYELQDFKASRHRYELQDFKASTHRYELQDFKTSRLQGTDTSFKTSSSFAERLCRSFHYFGTFHSKRKIC